MKQNIIFWQDLKKFNAKGNDCIQEVEKFLPKPCHRELSEIRVEYLNGYSPFKASKVNRNLTLSVPLADEDLMVLTDTLASTK